MQQSLILRGWTAEGAQQGLKDMPPTIFCSQTPKLRYVYLREVGLRWDTCVFPALRELTLAGVPEDHVPSTAQFSRMMEIAAPSLQRLTVTGVGPRPVSPSSGESPRQQLNRKHAGRQVVLPRLAELRLEDMKVGEIRTLVSLLATPVLRRLTLAHVDGDEDMAMSSPGSGNHPTHEPEWRAHQLSCLADLAFVEVPLSTGLFQAVCRAAPNITRLHVRGEATNAVLQYLTPEPLLMLPDEEELFLPRLTSLEMDVASADTVRAFIDARTATLREVKGSILNEARLKSRGVLTGDEAVRHLGWERNRNIHVAIQPTQPLAH